MKKDFRINREIKKNIAYKSMNFINTDDLLLLAEVYILAEDILRDNGFPIKKYKRFLKRGTMS